MNRHDIEERRRYPRSRRGIRVMLDAAGPGVLNHVDNISANGILCHTVRPVPLMTKVGIGIELTEPVSQRIDAEGIVVRCDPDDQGDDHFNMAILFTRLDDEAHDAIHRFVHHDLAQPEAEVD